MIPEQQQQTTATTTRITTTTTTTARPQYPLCWPNDHPPISERVLVHWPQLRPPLSRRNTKATHEIDAAATATTKISTGRPLSSSLWWWRQSQFLPTLNTRLGDGMQGFASICTSWLAPDIAIHPLGRSVGGPASQPTHKHT